MRDKNPGTAICATETARTRAQVLLADDDPLIRRFLTSLLDGRGFAVEAVDSGQAALDYLEAHPFTRIVVLDWQMPPPDGVRLCQILRQRYGRRIYIIAVTGRPPEQLGRLLEAGADDILSKPIEAREFATRMIRARHVVESGLRGTLLEAAEQVGTSSGVIIARDEHRVGRIHIHGGRVAWVHVTPPARVLTDVLTDAGLAREDLNAVADECRRTQQPFTEVLIEWRLMELDALRTLLAAHFEAELALLAELSGPTVVFIPGAAGPERQIDFSLKELAPWLARKSLPPTLHPPSLSPPGGPTPELIERMDACFQGLSGATALYLLDSVDGQCVFQAGEGGLDRAWAVARAMMHQQQTDPTEEMIVTTAGAYFLGRIATGGGHYIACLVLDRSECKIGIARFSFGAAVKG